MDPEKSATADYFAAWTDDRVPTAENSDGGNPSLEDAEGSRGIRQRNARPIHANTGDAQSTPLVFIARAV
jgi:hypothetical protein